MLQFLDVTLTIVHLAIVGFNLFGWIPKLTRKAHFVSIVLTAASWFLLGIFYGMGYCPFTDWQWQVKEKLGEGNLPANFIEYFAEKITGSDFNSQLINNVIAVSFVIVAIISVYVNFVHIRPKQKGINR
ncbi:MAG: DUF2784 domain-containing protein [Chitinophagaceae bacterium]